MSAAWFLGVAADQAAQGQAASLPGAAAPPLAWWRIAVLALLLAGLLGIWFYLNRSRFSLGALNLGLRPPGAASGRKIEVRDQRWVSARVGVALVEVDGQRFLLAHGPDAVSWQPLPSTPSTPPSP